MYVYTNVYKVFKYNTCHAPNANKNWICVKFANGQ